MQYFKKGSHSIISIMGCDMSFIKRATLGGASSKGSEEKFEKRILLLGLDNAGKTSLLFHVRDNQFRDTVPTVGLNIELIQYKRYSLTFWDVGGQATKLWKHYFDHIDAVVFVVDSTDEERIFLAKDELKRLLTSGNSTAASSQSGGGNEGLGDVPFLLMYNKRDLGPLAKSSEELSGRLEVESYREQGRQVLIQECSAKTGAGIWDGIDRLIAMFEGGGGAAASIPSHRKNTDGDATNQSVDNNNTPKKG